VVAAVVVVVAAVFAVSATASATAVATACVIWENTGFDVGKPPAEVTAVETALEMAFVIASENVPQLALAVSAVVVVAEVEPLAVLTTADDDDVEVTTATDTACAKAVEKLDRNTLKSVTCTLVEADTSVRPNRAVLAVVLRLETPLNTALLVAVYTAMATALVKADVTMDGPPACTALLTTA